jgi:hypothetical protein
MLSTTAQVLSIWLGVATIVALSLGATFGALSLVPVPAVAQPRVHSAGAATSSECDYRVGCEVGR